MALQAEMNTNFSMVVGTIGFVSVKEMAQPDQYDNTHRASFTIQGLNKSGDPKKEKDSIWFAAGSIKGDTLTAKDSNGNWVDVVKGCDVKFQYVKNDDWYNVKRSQMTVTKVVEAKSKAPANGGKNFDNTGIKAGHLKNCAENFLGEIAFSDQAKYDETVKVFDTITKRVADAVRAANPEYSVFDVDVNAGRAVLSASRNAGADFGAIEAYAINGASNSVHDVVLAVVKGAEKEAPKQEKAKPQEPDNTRAKINPQEPTIDFDDDIPF